MFLHEFVHEYLYFETYFTNTLIALNIVTKIFFAGVVVVIVKKRFGLFTDVATIRKTHKNPHLEKSYKLHFSIDSV